MNKNYLLIELIYGLYAIISIISYPFLIALNAIRVLYKCWNCNTASIAGQVALVTGSGRGLGREFSIALAKKGCHIAVADVQGALAEETAKYIADTYGVKTKAYKVDVTNYQQMEDLKTKITQDLGDVTILVNNAGILTLSSMENPPAKEVERMISVNLTALVNTTYLFLPKMKELNRGHIVNISSISALLNHHLVVVYGATKSAVRSFTASLRCDFLMSDCDVATTVVLPTFLTTNQRVHDLLKMCRMEQIFRPAEGSMVAEYAINGMLRGVEEVTVPYAFACTGMILGLLPSYIYNKLYVLLNRSYVESTKSETFRNLWNSNDVKTD